MALLRFKRSAVPAKVPSLADLSLGELAINTFDGKVYMRRDNGTASIVEVGGGAGVLSFNSRTGAVTLTSGDVTTALGYTPASRAGDTFTGNIGITSGSPSITLTSTTSGRAVTFGMTDAFNFNLSAPNGGVLQLGEFRAPIFRDTDNTAFFVDPAGTSSLNLLNVENDIQLTRTTNAWGYITRPNVAGFRNIQFAVAGGSQLENVYANTAALRSSGDVRGSMFYDEYNTAFFLDPASASNLNSVTFNGNATSVIGNSYFCFTADYGMGTPNSNGLQIFTGAGDSIRFGHRASGTFTERMRLDTSGDFIVGGTNGGGWRFRVEKSDAQQIALLNTAGNGNRINMADQSWQAEIEQNAGNLIFKSGGTTERMRINASGNVTANVDVRAPIFYDSNNTAFFTDPAGTSALNGLNVATTTPLFSNTGFQYHQYQSAHIAYVKRTGGFNWYWRRNDTGLIGGANEVEDMTLTEGGALIVRGDVRAPIFLDSQNTAYYCDPNSDSIFFKFQNINQRVAYDRAWGNFPSITVYNTTDQGPQTDFRIHGIGGSSGGDYNVRLLVDGTIESLSDVRGPAFFDSNDTAFYLNPASDIRVRALKVTGETEYPGSINGDWEGGYYHFSPGQDTPGANWGHAHIIRLDGTWNVQTFWPTGNSNEIWNRRRNNGTYSAWRRSLLEDEWIGNKYFGSNGDIYGTIFYDANNSGFYVDPTGTSVIVGLTVGSGQTASTITMADADEGGRLIHCNSNRIGFLTQGGGWGAWCDDSGWWGTDVDMRAPIYYDINDTFYYLNPAGYSQINGNGSVNGSSGVGLNIMSVSGNGAIMAFHRAGFFAFNMGLDSDNVFRMGGWSMAASRLQMDTNGNLTMAGNVTAFSDVRLKKDIQTIDGALDLVLRMRGVRFTRIENNERNVGVVAQEMLEVLPEVVQQGVGDDDTLSVAYGNLVGVLIEAIKELTNEIETLKADIRSK